MNSSELFYVFITALFSSLIMVPALRRWALDRGELDVPDDRKVHTTATPRLGGIAVFIAFLFSILLYVEIGPAVRGVAAGGLVIFMTGLLDDLHGLTPKRKFFGEIVACLIAMIIGDLYLLDLGNLFGLGRIVLPFWLGAPFTLFAVVGVINAANLIDGLDGLAGGVSVIALSAFFVLGLHYGNTEAMALSAAMIGAMLGFLKYNFYPARIFMGDTGSLVVGFVLAFLAIHLTQQPPGSAVKPVMALIILGVPIIDTLWVMSRRILHRLSPFTPDRSHVHHKFLDLGFQHRYTVLIIYGLSLFWALFAVTAHRLPDVLLLVLFLLGTALFYMGLRSLIHHQDRCQSILRDSSQGLRNSRLYGRLADFSDRLAGLTVFLLLAYLLLAVTASGRFPAFIWQIFAALLLAALALLFILRGQIRHYLFFLCYLGVLGLTYAVNHYAAETVTIAGAALPRLCNATVLTIAAIILIKILFRKNGEFFVSSVDILVLGISIFLAAFFHHVHPAPAISWPLLQGFVLYLGVKVSFHRNTLHARLVTGGMVTALVAVTVRGIF